MPTLSDLANVLIKCRVVSRARWDKAARTTGGVAAALLDELTAHPPEWWSEDEGPEPPPGLTDYQRAVIEAWLDGDEAPLAPQLAVNQFLLLEQLGAGGQGQVFRGRQLNPARFVAIKTLTRETDTSRARFEQEARAMMRVQHPTIARFHLYERVRDEHNRPTNEYLIAMEFVDGSDLNRLVRWSGPIPWPFVVKWAIDLLGGLAAIHQSGFVHRDVKPANVIALGPPPEAGTRPGETAAKLLDFGAVSTTAQPQNEGAKRMFVGTREYAPPEQWRERVVPESDLYALGGTLFFLLTGRAPYIIEGRDAIEFMKAHTRAPVPSAREHNPDVPQALDALIQTLMAKRPADRGTAAELSEAFAQLLPSEAAAAPPARKPKKPAPLAPRQTGARTVRISEPEERGALDRVCGPVLSVFERLFLPALMRPTPGHEPSTPERVAVLLTRPAVLLVLLVLLGGCIFLAVR
ncbi:serine/threonine-protein kinase [Gemmata sp. JC717]|uniref:serine/threonine-protein kinase n=1 Tax=Gemmata algarum TaxID=2975278 RepID=UPI0021BAB43C|nr:serine/threonine-protein kinase [Gemmata algarum]MDY3551697.1 serine/threonine-protein kinase [Gemmata algarum]